jgi:UDPglucose 6-dehydrogenase
MQIGIIGVGFVGKAVKQAFSFKHNVIGYDNALPEYKETWPEILKCAMVFVCVPTPTIVNRQNIDALHDVLQKLSDDNYEGPVVVKCTVLPGTMARYQKLRKNLTLVHNPEFLTAVASFADFMSQKTVLISTKLKSTAMLVYEAYRTVMPNVGLIYDDCFQVTECAKYMSNCFLASKVTWCNEFANVCTAAGADYDDVLTMALSQGLIAPNHTRVPGPDGQRGYGGACFPKDVKALATYAQEQGVVFSLLQQTDRTNDRIRGDK